MKQHVSALALALWLSLPILSIAAPPRKLPPPPPPPCARCAEVLAEQRDRFDLCPVGACAAGGVPSQSLFEALSWCMCGGACSDICASACNVGADIYSGLDFAAASPACLQCAVTVAHAQSDPHGCGEVLQLCSADAPQ